MPNKVLETKNLNAYYGDFQALFEVSIDLFEGEIIAIIGANGCLLYTSDAADDA